MFAKFLSLTCELHVLVVLNDHRKFAKFLSLTWQVVYCKLACQLVNLLICYPQKRQRVY